jgi:hypothetical protein
MIVSGSDRDRHTLDVEKIFFFQQALDNLFFMLDKSLESSQYILSSFLQWAMPGVFPASGENRDAYQFLSNEASEVVELRSPKDAMNPKSCEYAL